MMVYFDTNVLVYTFCQNVDNEIQKEISLDLVEKSIKDDSLVVSEVLLCEFAFILNKVGENKSNIIDKLDFLSIFLQPSNSCVNQRVIEILRNTGLFVSTFDVYHLAFAESYNSKIVTFDKGYKKLKNLSKTEIIIK